MTSQFADATLTTLSVTELIFWTVTFILLAFLLWRVRDRKLDLPRLPLLTLATFFLVSHFFFDTYDDYLEIEPGQGVPASFLARAGIEALETLGFLFLILISLRVREAGHTIERQKEQLEEANLQLLQAAKLASVGELASGMAILADEHYIGVVRILPVINCEDDDGAVVAHDVPACADAAGL